MGYRDRPSETHIIWTRRTRNGATKKRFDTDRFERWAAHYGFDAEQMRRTDHERSEESRLQMRCVFAWGERDAESFEFGDEEWEIASQETPQTFVEIDEKGLARLEGWETETLCDIREMQFDGPVLHITTADGESLRVDGQDLADAPADAE
jgi:hypothetical protein